MGYCYTWRAWFIWNHKRWRRDDTGEIYRLAKKTVRSIAVEAATIDDSDRRKSLFQWSLKSEGKKEIGYMVALAESEPGIAMRTDDWDRDGWLFNTNSGTIDLRSGKLRPH